MFFSLIISAEKIITIIIKVIKNFFLGNEIRISSRMHENFFQVFHLSLIEKEQSVLVGSFIRREMAYNVTERIRSATWRGLSRTHDRFTSSGETILISTHSRPFRPSFNNGAPRAQQAIQAHSICISTPRYPLILLPHLNHYTFRSVHLPFARARLSSSRFHRTDAPKSLALVPSHLHFANCQTVVPLGFNYG